MAQTDLYDSAQRPSPIVEELVELFRYRDLILQFISRSVKTRYKRSFLGVAWTMINPLLTMAVLTLVFSRIFGFTEEGYALYVLSGLVFWNFFAQSTTSAMGDLLWSGNLLGRVFVPKSVFAVSAIGTGLVNLLLALAAYFLIASVLGARFQPLLLWLPFSILLLGCFALGIGLALSSISVFFSDVLPMYEVLLTIWLYMTPVIYPLELVPESARVILRLNPLYYLIDIFRSVLLLGEQPSAEALLMGSAVALGSLLLGWWVFTRRAREYAYRI